MFVQIGESLHRQTFEQHLHADKFLIDNRRFDQILKQIAKDFADGIGCAPT